MIIPVRCHTCGAVLASKWKAFDEACKELENKGTSSEHYKDNDVVLVNNFDKKLKGKILDDLGLDRICCRRHMLGHVELIDII